MFMQRGGRWRWGVKWGLLLGALFFGTLFLASWLWTLEGEKSGGAVRAHLMLSNGAVWLESVVLRFAEYVVDDVRTTWRLTQTWNERPFEWLPCFWRGGPRRLVVIPLWIPFLLTLGPYVLLARADRLAAKRAKAHACPSCGYSRAGLAPAVVCPECGKVGAAEAAKG